MSPGHLWSWLAEVLVAMAASPLIAAAATVSKMPSAPQAAVAKAASPASAPKEDITLDISIETSRANPVVGSNLGITAVFKNTSKTTTLYLGQTTTTMTLPPELEGPLSPVYGREAFFPSENDQWFASKRIEADRKRRQQAMDAGQEEPPPLDPPLQDVTVAIKPGHSYRAMWVHTMPAAPANAPAYTLREVLDSAWTQIMMEMRYLFFAPGEYKILVQAKVGADKLPTEPGYYTFSQVASIKAGAPQFVIILGAMIAALPAGFFFRGRTTRYWRRTTRSHGLGASSRGYPRYLACSCTRQFSPF